MGLLARIVAAVHAWTAPAPTVEAPKPATPVRSRLLSSDPPEDDHGGAIYSRDRVLEHVRARMMPVKPSNFAKFVPAQDGRSHTVAAMDDASLGAKAAFSMADSGVPDAQLMWYASQGFIGFQLMAFMAQNWLVDKACSIPARDAIRNGFELSVNNGVELPADALDRIKAADKRHGLKAQCRELVRNARIFGIRVVVFLVDVPDPDDYYGRPFNPDGITPGSYRGMSQVDPYWVIPELSTNDASNPASPNFYDPTYWVINGRKYHKSHLVIIRGPEVADVLKPSYQFAGISLVQRIYERVYAAERTANEAPQLALSKRTTVFRTDTGKAMADEAKFTKLMAWWSRMWGNWGIKTIGEGDEVTQHDTALGDFDTVLMSQYQLVASIANMPATKLLGTTPKGFNATGEHETKNYHEELESIQTNDMEPLVNRHHLMLIRSEIAPVLGCAPFTVAVTWNPTDSPTAKEEADIQKTKADTAKIYQDTGAIDGTDIRNTLIADPNSPFTNLPAREVEEPESDMPATTDGIALDGTEWDAVTGQYAEAELISNQSYLDEAIVAAKIAQQDFTVQVSPEFRTAGGTAVRVIIDGHHSLQAAIRAGVCPVFIQADYLGSDYRNYVTGTRTFADAA